MRGHYPSCQKLLKINGYRTSDYILSWAPQFCKLFSVSMCKILLFNGKEERFLDFIQHTCLSFILSMKIKFFASSQITSSFPPELYLKYHYTTTIFPLSSTFTRCELPNLNLFSAFFHSSLLKKTTSFISSCGRATMPGEFMLSSTACALPPGCGFLTT